MVMVYGLRYSERFLRDFWARISVLEKKVFLRRRRWSFFLAKKKEGRSYLRKEEQDPVKREEEGRRKGFNVEKVKSDCRRRG